MLKNFGYKVMIAMDGETALTIYRERHDQIDLVLLDLIMPGMGGIRCLEEMLLINPEVRTIIVSGYSANEDTKAKVDTLAKGFIHKPYEVKKMLRNIREVLDN